MVDDIQNLATNLATLQDVLLCLATKNFTRFLFQIKIGFEQSCEILKDIAALCREESLEGVRMKKTNAGMPNNVFKLLKQNNYFILLSTQYFLFFQLQFKILKASKLKTL